MPDSIRHPSALETITADAIRRALDTVWQARAVADAEVALATAETRAARRAADEAEQRFGLLRRAFVTAAAETDRVYDGLGQDLAGWSRPDGSAGARNAGVVAAAKRLAAEGALPFVDDAAFGGFLTDSTAGVRFAAALPRPAVALTTDPLCDTGTLTDAPEPASVGDWVSRTAHPGLLSVSPLAGLHVSVSRKGGIYRHHGIVVGDGTMVHFSGEPGQAGDKEICRVPVSAFLADSNPGTLRQHFPARTGMGPMPVLAPNLVVLQAWGLIGEAGYRLMSRNCEHFGTWAQCGAMLCGQLDHVWSTGQIKAAEAAAGRIGGVAMAGYLAAWYMTVDSSPLPIVPPSQTLADASLPLFDVGRVRRCADTGSLVWWLPVWRAGDPQRLDEPLEGVRERPWSLDPFTEEPVWHTSPPTRRLSSDWHAAVIADTAGRLFTVDQSGAWRIISANLTTVLASRVRDVEALHRQLAGRETVSFSAVQPRRRQLI